MTECTRTKARPASAIAGLSHTPRIPGGVFDPPHRWAHGRGGLGRGCLVDAATQSMQVVGVAAEQVSGLRSRAGWESCLELGATLLVQVTPLVGGGARRHTAYQHIQRPSIAFSGSLNRAPWVHARNQFGAPPQGTMRTQRNDNLQVAAHTLQRPSDVLLLHTHYTPLKRA